MTSQMYIITVRWLDPLFRPEKVDARLSAFGPWFRFNPSTWLVTTQGGTAGLHHALKSTLSPTDSFVILGVDPSDRQGYAPADFWDWLDANSAPRNVLADHNRLGPHRSTVGGRNDP